MNTPTDPDWAKLRAAEDNLRGDMDLEQWQVVHTQYLQALAACATKSTPTWYEEAATQRADLEQFDAIWDAMIDYREILMELVKSDLLYTYANCDVTAGYDMVKATLAKHGDLPE